MYNWTTMYALQRGEELRQEGEKQRLIRLALEAGAKRDPFYAPALAKLGEQLSVWGTQLQERYADTDSRQTVTAL